MKRKAGRIWYACDPAKLRKCGPRTKWHIRIGQERLRAPQI